MKTKQSTTIIFDGGLDLVTPALSVDPGKLLEVKNYECDLNGGYKVTAGFERFDGRNSPVDSSFFSIATGVHTGTFEELEVITGTTSGATGTIVTVGVEGLYLVDISGIFTAGEMLVGGTSSAFTTSQSTTFENITVTDAESKNDVRYDKEIYFRNLILVVPGINEIRGVFRHEDFTLAVRDFDGSEARMYKSTTSGWTQVAQVPSHIIIFESKTADFPVPGAIINDSVGNTAVFKKEFSATIAGTSGYIQVTGYTVGFDAGSTIHFSGIPMPGDIATTSEDAFESLISPGGKNEWRSHNFTGAEGFYKVYTANGVNAAMEYDPISDMLTPIYTDISNIQDDKPSFIEIYKNHLFVGFDRGLLRNSEPGDPFLWDAAAGTLEIAVGAQVTGLDAAPESIIVTTKRTTYALKGNTAEDFVLSVASARTGAIPYTMQHIGTTYMVDDRGIIELSRVQAFGDFENATVSRLIQPFLRSIRSTLVASTINLSNNIYKIFSSDGRGVSLTFQEGSISGFGVYDYGVNINVMSNSEDELGDERIFFGGSDGYIYEQDKGISFDGEEKEYWFRTVFQFLNSQTISKRFYRAFFDVSIVGTASISVLAEYSNGSPDVQPTNIITDTIGGFNSAWDIGSWDVAVFDATIVSNAYMDLTGTGDSISLILYGKSAVDDIFTMKDVVYHYKPRRMLRSSR